MSQTGSRYELRAYNEDQNQVSLNADPHAHDVWVAKDVWEAVSLLARVPSFGYLHYETETGHETESEVIAHVELVHYEELITSFGTRASLQVLETITR